jgi:hypothetical protein
MPAGSPVVMELDPLKLSQFFRWSIDVALAQRNSGDGPCVAAQWRGRPAAGGVAHLRSVWSSGSQL